MSRESSLEIRFSVSDSEQELVEQLAGVLKGIYSIDAISTDKHGIRIDVWNSEHYYLAEVMPELTRIVASVFPKQEVKADGTGTYSVVDDVHEYSANYDPKKGIISGSWYHYCQGLNEDYGTKYCLIGAGLPREDLDTVKRQAAVHGFDQLKSRLNRTCEEPALQPGNTRITWYDDKTEALNHYLRSLRHLVIPEEIEDVDGFDNSNRIETVTFHDKVSKICADSFRNCKSLREITIPVSVKELGIGAFANCTSLERVIIECDLDMLPENLFQNCSSLKNVVITGRVKKISKTFHGLQSLETVVLPDGLEALGADAFSGCESLTSINLPKTLKKIANNAFSGCLKLQVEIPPEIKIVSPFEVQDDTILQAIMCIQTKEEARDFVHFLGGSGIDGGYGIWGGFGLNYCKQYKQLIKQYENQPWYVEFKRLMEQISEQRLQLRSTRLTSAEERTAYCNKRDEIDRKEKEIYQQCFKMTFDEYANDFFLLFVNANDYEQAKKTVAKVFSEKEIPKINMVLTACIMYESNYKCKEISETLGVSSSVINTISKALQWGKKEGDVIRKLKAIY